MPSRQSGVDLLRIVAKSVGVGNMRPAGGDGVSRVGGEAEDGPTSSANQAVPRTARLILDMAVDQRGGVPSCGWGVDAEAADLSMIAMKVPSMEVSPDCLRT